MLTALANAKATCNDPGLVTELAIGNFRKKARTFARAWAHTAPTGRTRTLRERKHV
jgi:hypothetical protein